MTYPDNDSEGYWTRGRIAIETALKAIEKGATVSLAEMREKAGLTKTQARALMWVARKNVAKQAGGGVYVVSFKDETVYRMTDVEASENARPDANKGRRHIQRSSHRLSRVDTAQLDDGQTQKHRLREAQFDSVLTALSPQKHAAEERKMANGKIDAGNLHEIFGGDDE